MRVAGGAARRHYAGRGGSPGGRVRPGVDVNMLPASVGEEGGYKSQVSDETMSMKTGHLQNIFSKLYGNNSEIDLPAKMCLLPHKAS